MTNEKTEKRRPVLDPVERIMEILFGLIMVLTFTSSLSAATAGREEVRTMVFAALGCNLAWGIVDGVMYLLNTMAERGRSLRLLNAVRKAKDPAEAHRTIADTLPPILASSINQQELEHLRGHLQQLPEPPSRALLHREDFVGALLVLVIVFASTFPIVIPFMVFQETVRALRVSNAIALILLFAGGYRLGDYAGYRPWLMGICMTGIGVILVLLTLALGG